MNIKLKKIQIYEGYSIMAVQCYFCEMPAETFSQNNEPVCGKHAQQSVQPTLLTPRPETVVTKQNILAALEAINQSQSG